MLKPRERQRKVQICRLTVMDVMTRPPLFGFQIRVAQAADLVVVRQTLHRPVHDSRSTGDGALQDRSRDSYFISKVFWAPECSNTGLILIKQAIPLIINPSIIIIIAISRRLLNFTQRLKASQDEAVLVKVNHALT